MKIFILTTDSKSLENSDHADCEIIARREGNTFVCDFEMYPERLIVSTFNPVNGQVTLSFTLKPNEVIAVGTKNAKKP